jgi:hypothetical protein
MKDLCKATKAMGAASRSLSKANTSAAATLAGSQSDTASTGLQPLLLRFGETLEEISNAQDTLAFSLSQSFILPLEDFCAREMDKVLYGHRDG